MRILLVHPGASMSTADVHTGLKTGLQALGHEIYDYALDGRIERSGAWLTWLWRKTGKTLDKPTSADILYHSGEELVARALRVQPDVILVVSAMFLHPDVLVLMHRAGLKVATLFTESPYDDFRQVRLLPYLVTAWTNERASVIPGQINYMPHAYDPTVHNTLPVDDATVPAHDVVFVGTGFQERIDLIYAVDWDGIDLALYGSWDLLGPRNHLRKYLRGSYVDNAYAVQLYRKAKIGLNLYRQSMGFGKGAPRINPDAAVSMNPRAYELAATGCFTISDHRHEVAEVFGDLVPTFRKPEEVRPLLDRWLGDESGREAVRAALPTAVAGHTWMSRARQIEQDLHSVGIGASCAHHQSNQLPSKLASVGG